MNVEAQNRPSITDKPYEKFLSDLDVRILNWLKNLSLSFLESRRHSELRDIFVEQDTIKNKIPELLSRIGHSRNTYGKYDEYGAFFTLLKKHIHDKIARMKIQILNEHEILFLGSNQLLEGKQEEVERILCSKKSVTDKKSEIKRLIDTALAEKHVSEHEHFYSFKDNED